MKTDAANRLAYSHASCTFVHSSLDQNTRQVDSSQLLTVVVEVSYFLHENYEANARLVTINDSERTEQLLLLPYITVCVFPAERVV